MKIPGVQGDIQDLPLLSRLVTALQGRPVSNQTPTTNQVLAWNGKEWAPSSVAGGSGVPSVDGITGAVTLHAGSNVTITDNSPSPGSINIAAASGAVSSVFTRTGAVTAQSGDYTAAQVTNAADKSSGSQQAFTGEISAPDYVATGLTGATAASRYAGATAQGAPTSGTFAVGDHVIDQTGAIWICTSAGTPGTWVEVAAVYYITVGTNVIPANAQQFIEDYLELASATVTEISSGAMLVIGDQEAPLPPQDLYSELYVSSNSVFIDANRQVLIDDVYEIIPQSVVELSGGAGLQPDYGAVLSLNANQSALTGVITGADNSGGFLEIKVTA